MTSTDPNLVVPDALAAADDLVDRGELLEAVDLLHRANRDLRDAEIERRLMRLRLEASEQIVRSEPEGSWPPAVPDLLEDVDSPPEVAADELTVDALRAGIYRHGCVLVRGLVPQERVDRLVEGIDQAFAGYESHAAGEPASNTTPWFEPFSSVTVDRTWTWQVGGVFAVDSPRMMYNLIETLEDVGLGRLIEQHLGERPVLSATKCTLRRVPLDLKADWHQDGAFLGEGVRTVNVWLSLSHCGRDAPGLDIVPRRLDRIVETGTEGADFSWTVAPAMVQQACDGASVVRPIFEPGDALLFDQLLLHRGAIEPGMKRTRYATESWFFAPSTYLPGEETGGERLRYAQGSALIF